MMTRPLKVERPQEPKPCAPKPRGTGPRDRQVRRSSKATSTSGLAAFCRGAGIDPRSISTEARGAALQLAGQLLREAVLGLDGPESGPQRIPQSLSHISAPPMTDPNRR